MKKTVMMLMVSLFLMGAVSTAKAAVLPLNSSFVPNYGSGLIATTSALNYDLSGTMLLGTITQSVYSNSTGLLFAFDLNRTSAIASEGFITSMNASAYSNFIVEAGYSGTSATAPMSATNIGGLVTFYWDTNPLMQNEVSPTLFLQTNVPYLKTGAFSLQGLNGEGAGTTQNFTGYAPSATPEPATAVLLGTGLLGLLGFRRKMGA